MLKKWVVEKGVFEIMAGSSSRDIRLSKRCSITDPVPYTMSKHGEAIIG